MQHLRPYHDGYQLVPVRTQGAFIVLPRWMTRQRTSKAAHEEFFFQSAISAIPKYEFAMQMAILEVVLWGKKLQIYKYVHMYRYLKSSFPKRNPQN